MSKPIIEIENLSKLYKIGANREPYLSLRDEIAKFASRLRPKSKDKGQPETDFWALNDVSFSVQEGEAVGIIGRNGAGKSTLLKILSQITPPTKGQIIMRGRVASLLEVGTGFHPELTGRENIFLNGAVLGMTRSEIRKKFDEIVAFAEIQKFLDTPVKRYSSGMYVRLAFAVAAHLEPEILVVDEVLAVGDAQFQKKCLGKMEEVAKGGRTVLFVSHNMAAIQSLCKRTINLNSGCVAWDGCVGDGISNYLMTLSGNNKTFIKGRIAKDSGDIYICEAYVANSNGDKVQTVLCGEDINICMKFTVKNKYTRCCFAIDIYNSNGYRVAYCNSMYTTGYYVENLVDNSVIMCNMPKLPLFPDKYRIDLAVHVDGVRSDYIQGAINLYVNSGDYYGTGKIAIGGNAQIILLDHNWNIM